MIEALMRLITAAAKRQQQRCTGQNKTGHQITAHQITGHQITGRRRAAPHAGMARAATVIGCGADMGAICHAPDDVTPAVKQLLGRRHKPVRCAGESCL